MFERYTEAARQAIFFARYEAVQAGKAQIEPEHLLLGVARADAALFQRLAPGIDWAAAREVLSPILPGSVSQNRDLPVSHDTKWILSGAAAEAERPRLNFIDPRHLLLAMLVQEESKVAQFLSGRGIGRERLEADLAEHPAKEYRLPRQVPEHIRTYMEQMRARVDDQVRGFHDAMAGVTGGGIGGGQGFGMGGGRAGQDSLGRQQGRMSSGRVENGVTITETLLYVAGQPLRMVERVRESEDRKAIHFQLRVTGPDGMSHEVDMEYPFNPDDSFQAE